MARLAAFRGTTYNTALVDPADVVAPPYDVVNKEERAELSERSPYNSILVELPDDPAGGDRYQHAAVIWRQWHEQHVVEVAASPSLYVYRMTFRGEDGATLTTTGVLGALELDPGHTGEVLPHEQTISKDKHDRLSLLRATRTNFSPIWGLSLASGLAALCETATARAGEPLQAVDDSGALHECWTIDDPAVLEEIASLAACAPVLIADGHHRYETACAYMDEQRGSAGSGALLALVIELSEHELAVHAIHRLISGVEPKELVSRLEASFKLVQSSPDALELHAAMAHTQGLGLLTGAGGWLLVPRFPAAPGSDDDLDSIRLERALEDLQGVEIAYQHGVVEAGRAVSVGRAAAAVLLRPVSVEQIARTAHGGRRMPPKSTFFYPKPRTGMVFRELDA
ncbi:MAG: DUF1015 family protein [Acidimicrobiales bacterium]